MLLTLAVVIDPHRMRAEPEPSSLCLCVSVSGASTLHSCLPRSDTDAEDDQNQTTSFIKIYSQCQPLTQIYCLP